jgi:hypothetical protein
MLYPDSSQSGSTTLEKNEAKRKFLKRNEAKYFFFLLRSEKFEAKRSENKRKNWLLIFA